MDLYFYINVAAIIVYFVLFYLQYQRKMKRNDSVMYLILFVAIITYILTDGPYEATRAAGIFIMVLLDLGLQIRAMREKKTKQ